MNSIKWFTKLQPKQLLRIVQLAHWIVYVNHDGVLHKFCCLMMFLTLYSSKLHSQCNMSSVVMYHIAGKFGGNEVWKTLSIKSKWQKKVWRINEPTGAASLINFIS